MSEFKRWYLGDLPIGQHRDESQQVYLCSDVDNAPPKVCKCFDNYSAYGLPPFCPYCGGLITHD